ncbi:hypothetical protein ACN28S_27165 [Cystobacter fuscus]
MFKWFDQNGDGWITQDDIEKMVKLFTALADEKDQRTRVR